MNERKIAVGRKKKEQTMTTALKRKPPVPPQQQRKRRRDQGKKKNDMFKHWNELPNDLLRVIMERLTRVDRIRIRTVCKDWLIPTNGIPHHPFDKLPWIMAFIWKRTYNYQVHSTCELIDPFHDRKYVVEATNKRRERWQFVGAKVRASRNGWVLFSNNEFEQDFFPVNGTLVFAFCPFTDEVVQLPEFEGDFRVASFSTTPTLPDCVFFVVSAHGTRLEISTCHPGDKTWTRFVYYGDLSLELLDTNYADGNFYCVFVRGFVGAFNIMLQEWNLLSNVEAEFFAFDREDAKIVANREELLLLNFAVLWRFDLLQREWKLTRKLENRTVFLGTTSFWIPAVGMLSEFSSKLYFLGEYYSHGKGPIKVCDFKRNSIDSHRLYSGITGQTVGPTRIIWIEPPLSLCSS